MIRKSILTISKEVGQMLSTNSQFLDYSMMWQNILTINSFILCLAATGMCPLQKFSLSTKHLKTNVDLRSPSDSERARLKKAYRDADLFVSYVEGTSDTLTIRCVFRQKGGSANPILEVEGTVEQDGLTLLKII